MQVFKIEVDINKNLDYYIEKLAVIYVPRTIQDFRLCHLNLSA